MKRTLVVLVGVAVLCGCVSDPEAQKQRFFALGDKYLEREQYQEATILYRKAIQQDARFTQAYCQLAEAELGRKDVNAAVSAFYQCFDLDPTNLRAFSVVADAHLAAASRSGALEAAVRQLIPFIERAERNNDEAFEIVYVKGVVAEAQQDVSTAIKLFRRAAELRPDDQRVALALAGALLAGGQEEEFERTARAGLERDPSIGGLYDLLYVHFYRSGRVAEAEAILQTKADSDPNSAAYQLDLVGHYWREGRKDTAERLIKDRLIARQGDIADVDEQIGDFFLRAGEVKRAIDYYQAGRAISSDSESAKRLAYKTVIALTANRQWAAAEGLIEELLVQDPDDPQAISIQSALRLQSGEPDQIAAAVQDLEQLVRRVPKDAVLRYRLGDAHLRNRDTRNAELQFNEALALDSTYVLPKYGLMNLRLSRNELAGAAAMAEEILEQQPNDPVAILGRAIARIGLGQIADARTDLEGLVERNQMVDDATFQLARIDVAQRQIASAEQRLETLAARTPDSDRARVGLASLYSATGRTAQARDLLRTRVDQAPDRIDYRFDLALFSARIGRSGEAIDELRAIVQEEPKHHAARVALGELLRRSGEPDEAKAQFLAATEGENPSEAALVKLGTMSAAAGEYEESRQYYERALAIAPDNAIANNNLAYILAETNTNLDAALAYAERAKAAAPDNPDFTDTLGLVYLKRGLHANAVEVLRQIVDKHPSRVPFRYHYAEALFASGKPEEAKKELAIALESRPSVEEEREIRQLLGEIGSS